MKLSLLTTNFMLLWTGHIISQFGSQIAAISLIFWLKDQTGLASIMGLSSLMLSLSRAFFSPLGGVIADRYDRKKILIYSDICAGLAACTLPFSLVFFPEHLPLLIGIVLLMQIIFGSTLGFYDPAYSALLVEIVSKKNISLANAIKNATIQLALLTGQGIGLFLYAQFGIVFILLTNSVSFFLSAIAESFIKQSIQTKSNDSKSPPHSSPSRQVASRLEQDTQETFLQSLKHGFVFAWQTHFIRTLLLLIGFVNFFEGPFVVLLPFFIDEVLGVSAIWYGYLIAGFGVGALAGYLTLPLFKTHIKDFTYFTKINLLLFGVVLLSLGLIQSVYATLALFSLAGYFFGVINIMIESALLTYTSDSMRGRVMGVYWITTRLMLPLGMVIAGVINDFFEQSSVTLFIVSGIAILITALFIFQKESFNTQLSELY
ncbi:MFS transporter [Zooshikella marina]|uniref:MFS transporter n=1 Tax=Zooshikella ganghwensis TaxID=202772 RepID=UPI001BB0B9DF|nr:MFS transporter [Zooshikella ganghwensis]MBU2707627.1 MFS transporter [Zooshikella ganghwensis]